MIHNFKIEHLFYNIAETKNAQTHVNLSVLWSRIWGLGPSYRRETEKHAAKASLVMIWSITSGRIGDSGDFLPCSNSDKVLV